MAAMFVTALTIPEAFDDLPGGLYGPVVIAFCYFAFRALHLVLFWVITSGRPGLRRQLVRFAPSMLAAPRCCWSPRSSPARCRPLLWAAALAGRLRRHLPDRRAAAGGCVPPGTSPNGTG